MRTNGTVRFSFSIGAEERDRLEILSADRHVALRVIAAEALRTFLGTRGLSTQDGDVHAHVGVKGVSLTLPHELYVALKSEAERRRVSFRKFCRHWFCSTLEGMGATRLRVQQQGEQMRAAVAEWRKIQNELGAAWKASAARAAAGDACPLGMSPPVSFMEEFARSRTPREQKILRGMIKEEARQTRQWQKRYPDLDLKELVKKIEQRSKAKEDKN